MRRPAALAAIFTLVMLPTAATAAWTASGAGTVAVAAPALTNPVNLKAACGSKNGNEFSIVLTWEPSQHPAAIGYEITRISSAAASVSGQVTGASTSTVTDSVPAGSKNTTIVYSYTIRARSAHSWTMSTVVSSNTVSVSNSCSA